MQILTIGNHPSVGAARNYGSMKSLQMCQQCSALQTAHRSKIQIYLHLKAQEKRPAVGRALRTPELDAALSEAASGINAAWERLVEHQAGHQREALGCKAAVSECIAAN